MFLKAFCLLFIDKKTFIKNMQKGDFLEWIVPSGEKRLYQ